MSDVASLIQELESRDDAPRWLSDKVLRALGWYMVMDSPEPYWKSPNGDACPDGHQPHVTLNVQDALDFAVPEGWSPQSVLWNDRCVGCYLRKGPITTGGLDDPNIRYGKGATPALAASSAALRAREADSEKKDD